MAGVFENGANYLAALTINNMSTNGITLSNLSILKTGKAKVIRFSTLETICRELNYQHGYILEFDLNLPVEEDKQ